jgi:DNA-binding response OmpR family regulator
MPYPPTDAHSLNRPAARPDGPLRVLVADGYADTAWTLAAVLRSFGEDARHACDGPGALRVALEFLPDVVIMDVDLPGLSGYDVARQMRAADELSSAMLVAVTGYQDDRHRCLAHEAGFDQYLLKPVSPEEFPVLLSVAARRTRNLTGNGRPPQEREAGPCAEC